jgi:glycosyltransferase involved in cell wall biosynthesis
MTKKFHLAVINSHPIQYFTPLYEYLNKCEELKITCLYLSNVNIREKIDPGFKREIKWDIDLLNGYSYKFIGNSEKVGVSSGFLSLVVPEIWKEVRTGNYDGLWLHGYNYAANLIAFAAAKSIGIPVFFRGETHLKLKRSAINNLIHRMLTKLFFKLVDAFLSIGSENKKYYQALGVEERKIFHVPYTVDNERFMHISKLSEEERKNIRNEYKLQANIPVILYASKFMKRKHPEEVLKAASVLGSRGHKFTVFMVGSGEMDEELISMTDQLNLTNVVFGGFINQTMLPKVYAVSDIFVLPSENEPWGLIVNEVMCAGKPVIVGSEVGCVADLVMHGVNGYQIEVGQTSQLVDALEKLLEEPERRSEMGRKSLEIMNNWNYEVCKIGIMSAVNSVAVKLNSTYFE